AEPVGGSLPHTADRPAPAGPYDGTTRYGTSNSLFVGLVIHAPRSRRFGLRLIKGSGNLVADCLIRGVALNGIMLHGSAHNTVRGNKVSNVGIAGDPDYQAGIVVVADSSEPNGAGNLIESNEVFDDQTAPTTRYGVTVAPNPGGDVGG